MSAAPRAGVYLLAPDMICAFVFIVSCRDVAFSKTGLP